MKPLLRLLSSPTLLASWTLLALLVPAAALGVTEHLGWGGTLLNILLPGAFYALVLGASPRTGRQVWFLLPFLFLAAFQVVLLFLFGNSVIGVDMFLNVLTTNPSEALEMLGSLLTGVGTVMLLYGLPLGVAVGQMVRHRRASATTLRRLRRAACGQALGAVGACALLLMSAQRYRPQDDLFPLNACYNVYLAASRAAAMAHYERTSATFSFGATATHEADVPETYFLVIGETARAANFQLYGYARETTPHLTARATETDSAAGGGQRLFAFADVLTESNTTHKSVPLLLAPASATTADSLCHQRSLLSAFREAGFYTVFLSNQQRNHSLIDRFAEQANRLVYLADAPAAGRYDAALVPRLRDILGEGHRKLLVVLHTYGSHSRYHERYPASEAHFRPDQAADARPANRASLLNAYDNTIRATDALLHQLIGLHPTALLYTSDHGENIYDDGRHLFLHAAPRPSYWDMHVPLLVWLSEEYTRRYPDAANALHAHLRQPVSSSASTFHTLLHLAGIATPYRADSLSLASAAYHCRGRFYLDDRNRAIPLQALRLSPEDLEEFRRRGLRWQ